MRCDATRVAFEAALAGLEGIQVKVADRSGSPVGELVVEGGGATQPRIRELLRDFSVPWEIVTAEP